MARDEGQERTEEATEKRLRESREKGQVARSKELTTLLLVMGGAVLFMFFGKYFSSTMLQVVHDGLTVTRAQAFDLQLGINKSIELLIHIGLAFLPFLLVLFVLAIFSAIVVGGLVFSFDAISPKLERMDPIKGIKKMFSVKSVVELSKALLKFSLVALTFICVMSFKLPEIFTLDKAPLEIGVILSTQTLVLGLLLMGLALILIAAIDVPFVMWDHARQLKMTKQEIKDEAKDTEGKPEVKGKQRQIQREIARRRQIANVPTADVIITNPEHYAVAVKYNENMSAPVVVAKGVDLIAEMIKKVAKAHRIPFVRAPEIARSIYYNVELEAEIPSGLYLAVAQILAYVYEVKHFRPGQGPYPSLPKRFDIPEELRR